MKAIIPVAGAGTTLRPHTHTNPKPLIPVAGKPILGHIMDSLEGVGVTEFVFVVGYMGEKIKQFVVEYANTHAFKYDFVVQEPRQGIGQAIYLCREAIALDQPVVIALGDTIVDTDMQAVVNDEANVLCVSKVDNPWQFGVAVLEGDTRRIISLIEKPSIPKSNLALVGLYKISDTRLLFESLAHIIDNDIRTRGEFQLTDALMRMIENGAELHIHSVDKWHDCGKKDVLLETNRTLLDRMDLPPVQPYPDTIIHPPVYIPDSCEISHSIIGPYVAMGENAVARHTIVTNSILGAYSRLESIILEDSVVGNDTALKGRSHSINIGENTEIDFSR